MKFYKAYFKSCVLLFLLSSLMSAQNKSIVMQSVTDFPMLTVDGFVPSSKNLKRKVLSVNAGKYKDVYAAARGKFSGPSGIYSITLNTLKEFDGESTYRIFINGKQVGKYQNPRTDKTGDFKPAGTTFKNIYVKEGASIQVEFNSHTNGLIPEKGGTAYARGRWSSLVFKPENSTSNNSKIKRKKK